MTQKQIFWRRIIIYTLVCIILSLLQVSPSGWDKFLAARPDLTLILAVLSGYLFGGADGFMVGLAAGFLRDLLAGRAIGLGMLLLMFAGISAASFLQRFFRRNVFFALLQVALLSVFYDLTLMLITYLVPATHESYHSWPDLINFFLPALPGRVLANVLAAIPVLFFLLFAGPYRRKRKEKWQSVMESDSLWRAT